MNGFLTQVEYLAQKGVLGKSDEEIKTAKQEYKRMYKRESKKRQRLAKKEYRALFTKEEVRVIQATAKEHGKAVSTFIHDAALAYINTVFIVPNPDQVVAMERMLARIYLDIRSIKERVERGSGNQRLDLLSLMRGVEEMEGELRSLMRTPPRLLDLVRDASPELRSSLLSLITP